MPAMQAVTNFVDGNVVHQGDLNNLSTNIDTLCQQTTGKTAAQAASSKPVTQVDINANQSIPDTTLVLVSWNLASTSITDTIWVASAPTVLTIITPGWYAIEFQVCWSSGRMQNRVIGMMVNGTVPTANSVAELNDGFQSITDVTLFKQRVSAYVHLSQGATLYGYVVQTSGGAINIVPNSVSYPGTFMSVRWDAP